MSRFRLLFVTPPYHPYNLADEKVYVVEPIQFEVLASLIDRRKYEVRIVDQRLDRRRGAVQEAIRDYKPHLVGVSSWTMHVTSVRQLCAEVKAYDSSIVTMVGGHHAGITPSDFADPNVDFVVMGEAYVSFRDLLDRVFDRSTDFKDLDGVAYRQDGVFHSNGTGVVRRSFDLNSLPFPDRSILGRYRSRYYHLWWRPVASLRTGMGCPSRCGFCNLWRPNLGKYLTWNPEYVVEQLRQLDEPYVLFVDDHFFGDAKRAYEIGEKILAAGIRKEYCLYSRSDAIARHPELVALWARVGLKRVRMGLESYSDKQLDGLTKCNSVENNDLAISILKKHQVFTEGLFMIGLDYTHKEFGELAEYIKSRKIEVPNITVYTPMPGTTEFEEVKGRLLYQDSEYFDFQHATLTTRLDLETFCKLYGKLLLAVQRPPQEQVRLIGIKRFLQRMPSFWSYFFSVRRSHRHYRLPPHPSRLPPTLPWHDRSHSPPAAETAASPLVTLRTSRSTDVVAKS